MAVNADNPQELSRLDALVAERAAAGQTPGAPLGLRINPQVGTGAIGAMSTATATSKFGVALRATKGPSSGSWTASWPAPG